MHEPAVTHPILLHCASTRLTLPLLALLAVGVLAGYVYPPVAVFALATPLALLALNLLAAAATKPVFRRQAPLLVTHLALLALVLLVVAGRLSALDGRMELTQGLAFDGRMLDYKAGPLHRLRLSQAAFTNDGFGIEYEPGLRRGATRNTVSWTAAHGGARRAVIGDREPLVLHGYRFYTTSNKGFAPVFTWRAPGGEAVQGAVHLPSYPMHLLRQARSWTLPDGTEVWVMLQSDETVIDPARPSAFDLPRNRAVVLRIGEQRFELGEGARVALAGGTLGYEGLRTWMGYRVYYDWTLPWLLAASVLAAVSLGLHFALKFRRQPWRLPQPAAAPAPSPGDRNSLRAKAA